MFAGACAARQAALSSSPPPAVEEAPAAEPPPPEVRRGPWKAWNDPVFDAARTFTLHALDVGQGAATLLEFPCGAMLVDAGAEVSTHFDGVKLLKRQLEAFFARRTDLQRRLDVLVLTHPHLDHVRGAAWVLSALQVGALVDDGRPGAELARPLVEEVLRLAQERNIPRRSVTDAELEGTEGYAPRELDPLVCPEVDPRIRALHGGFTSDPGWGLGFGERRNFDNDNNHSVALRVDFGKASVLITGDLEEPALRTLNARWRGTGLLDVDLYVVGHHGSHNGTTRELVDAMTPLAAVVSMGRATRREDWTAWKYGHPRQKAIAVIEAADSLWPRPFPSTVQWASGQTKFDSHEMDRAVFGTGWDGPVDFRLASDGSVAVKWRDGTRPRASPSP
ncbi:MAG: MBL fold metallo-hydrolase [Deltaproteobacteria bacterium]|nr:MBL fold metallo-hydrolase [Deltaproteobacteria bacterium]